MEIWTTYFVPLIEQYRNKKHPLDYKNRYQLMVMVILSARDSDKHINNIAPKLFEAFPTLQSMSKVNPEDLYPYVSEVINYNNKANWIINIARLIGEDDKIPYTLAELTKLTGIGRKSANVIIRESGGKAEGTVVDLHVVRVAPRIGVGAGTNPEKIEKQLMEAVPDNNHWNDLGMCISFLGREICRPTAPKCSQCVMNVVCQYYGQIREGKEPQPVKVPMKEPKRNF
jgi:endonuclease III